MAISVATGSFNTGTGAVSSTTAVTGLGFQPKALILHWIGRTEAVDTVGRATKKGGYGFATGTSSQRSACFTSVDAGASSDGGMYYTDANLICTNDGTAADGLMALQSFDSGGFTLVVNDVMPSDIRVSYIAFGGDDITNATTGRQTFADATTGNQSVTGLGWQPSVGFWIGIADSNTPPFVKTDRDMLSFGAAVSSSLQFVLTGGEDDSSANMDTAAYIYDGECIAIQNVTTPTSTQMRATFVSFDSGGYTVNVLEQGAGAVRQAFYLLMAGGSWSVNGVTTQTDTTTDITVSGLSFTPVAGIVVGANRAKSTQDTPTTNHSQSFGVFTSTSNRVCHFMMDENGTANAEVTTAIEFDAVYGTIDTASAVVGLMDVKSMDSGGVTFIMDDADPSGYYAAVVTVGNSPAAPTSTYTGWDGGGWW